MLTEPSSAYARGWGRTREPRPRARVREPSGSAQAYCDRSLRAVVVLIGPVVTQTFSRGLSV
jgi:hypothetical protein